MKKVLGWLAMGIVGFLVGYILVSAVFQILEPESSEEVATPFNKILESVGGPSGRVRNFELLPLSDDYLNNLYKHPNSDTWVTLQPHPLVGGYVTYGSDRTMPVQLTYASFPEGQWLQATTKDGQRLPLALRRVGQRMFGQWLE